MSDHSYHSFHPSKLIDVVTSKAFVPFQLSSSNSDSDTPQSNLAALAASQHQRHAPLLTLSHTATFADALAFFRQYDVTCAPITNDPTHSKPSDIVSPHSLIGLFVVADLIRPLIHHSVWNEMRVSSRPISPETATSNESNVSAPTHEQIAANLAAIPIWTRPIVEFATANIANRENWFFSAEQTVADAARSLSQGFKHVLVHEGPVDHSIVPAQSLVTPLDKLADSVAAAPNTSTPNTARKSSKAVQPHTYIVSQGDLIRYIYTSMRDCELPKVLSNLLASAVSAHQLTTTVITARETDLALRGFRLLYSLTHTTSVGAVAVVDSSGRCVDTLSASDIRRIQPTTVSHLLQPLDEFLTAVPVHATTSKKSLRPSYPMSVSSSATVNELLDKLVTNGISRIWITDADSKPVGVVSQTDVLRWLCATQAQIDEANKRPHTASRPGTTTKTT